MGSDPRVADFDPSNPFAFSHDSMCGLSLNPTAVSIPASAGNYEVDVTTGSGCDWAVADALPRVTGGQAAGRAAGRCPNFSSRTFGVVSSQPNSPRRVHPGLKLNWQRRAA